MNFFQIAILGKSPSGPLYETRSAAEREIRFLKADDRRYADDALRDGGIIVDIPQYEIVEVSR